MVRMAGELTVLASLRGCVYEMNYWLRRLGDKPHKLVRCWAGVHWTDENFDCGHS